MKHGKKYQDSAKLIDHLNQYDPDQATELVISTGKAKFDETVEAHIRLGVDPRHADQQVRGAVVLPHGTGRTVRVLVIAKGAKAEEARAAGADYVGDMDMITKIQQENWFEFDVCVATPDMMGLIGRIGRILGPKGLMPNPKSGTVTMDVTKAISDIKAGKVEYRVDKTAIAHCPIGKVSFEADKLNENLSALMDAIIKDLMLACNLASMFDFSSGTEALKQSLLRFFRFWYGKNQEILGLLLQNGLESRLTKFALKLAQEEHIALSCPTQRKFPSEKIKRILLASNFFTILAYWISNDCQESPEEMAEYVTNYLSNPIYQAQ